MFLVNQQQNLLYKQNELGFDIHTLQTELLDIEKELRHTNKKISELEEWRSRFLSSTFGIGSIMVRYDNVNPSKLFGLQGTHWERLRGYFLFAGDQPGAYGGSFSTDGTALTIDNLPPHNHTFTGDTIIGETAPEQALGFLTRSERVNVVATGVFRRGRPVGSGGRIVGGGEGNGVRTDALRFEATPSGKIGRSGGGKAPSHTFTPPFLQVSVWRRVS